MLPLPPDDAPRAARPAAHASPPATGAARLALRALQVGAALVALAALREKLFELDRFFVPKELVLHVTAAVVAVALLGWPARWAPARWGAARMAAHPPERSAWLTDVDVALALYLGLSALSAALAPNAWLATRALALSASGVVLFWGGRALARAGHGRALLAALAAGTALAAATSLAQAYGVESAWFSLNRAPGGTFGNRNFVAHLAAIGTPLLAGVLLRARVTRGAFAAALGLVLVAAVLVLSRSRGAWLAAAAASVPLAVGIVRAMRLPGTRPKPGRVLLVALALGAGVSGALTLPNTLDWKSDSPYLDSVKGVVDYRGGSGRGRLRQWTNSARMALAHPLLGVGPGNWAVRYPAFAPPGDPSLVDGGLTANPWPSSDWVAVLSERGVAAFAALAGALGGLLWWAHRLVWRRRDADAALVGGVLGAVVAATATVGAFDAVLLLAAPALVAWPAFGALAVEGGATDDARRVVAWSPRARRAAFAMLGVVAASGAVRSATQAAAMTLFGTGRAGAIATAGALDPGSYRIRLRQAELAAARGRCAEVRRHAGAAAALLPEAVAPKRLLARCGGSKGRRVPVRRDATARS